MISSARWFTKTGFERPESQILFVDDVQGEVVLTWTKSKKGMDKKLIGAYEWVQEARNSPPTKVIKDYQIPLDQAKRNFRNTLDTVTRFTYAELTDKDTYYDGQDPAYFLEIWEEFFVFQKWHNLPTPRPARPVTPTLDFYADLLHREVGSPSFTLANARGRLRAQLNNRRFRIMAEKVDAAGDLMEYRLRQPPYIDMQKEAKQYEFSRISKDASLTDDEKANQIQTLTETMLKPNGKPRRFAFDDDPAAPVIEL